MIDWLNQQLLFLGGEEFLRPELAWLPLVVLTVGLLAWRLWVRARVRRGQLIAADERALRRLFVPTSRMLRNGLALLCLAGLMALSIAATDPAEVGFVPRDNAVVMNIVDSSGSMNEPAAQTADGLVQTKLEAMVAINQEFIRELPEEFMVGLTGYSDVQDVEVLVSPRQDRQPIVSALDGLEASGGTALGEGIVAAATAVENFNAGAGYRPELQPPSVAVLLSDGAWDQGVRPEEAVLAAQAVGMTINTISFGAEGTDQDPETMKMIAETTGGRYFSAEDAGQLEQVYDQLKDIIGYEEVLTSVAWRYATAGGVLLAASLLIAMNAVRGPLAARREPEQEETEWTMYAA